MKIIEFLYDELVKAFGNENDYHFHIESHDTIRLINYKKILSLFLWVENMNYIVISITPHDNHYCRMKYDLSNPECFDDIIKYISHLHN